MNSEVETYAGKMMNSAVFGQIIILIVYLPILSLQGVEGKMFKPMAQTVAFALLGAFILSLTYIPMMSSLVLSKKISFKKNFSDKIMEKLEVLYEKSLNKVISFSKIVMFSVFGLFVFSIFLLTRLGGEFIPTLPEGDFAVDTRVLSGSNLGTPHNFYTLNYNTPSPFNNTFDSSLSYGQMLTYNSAINALGDGPDIQSQGFVGGRFGNNFSFSTNNDASIYGSYLLFNKNNKTDAGWTGGIVINAGGIEFCYQNFSGYWPEFGKKDSNGEPLYPYGHVFSAENRANIGQNGKYHQGLNRAFNFVRKGSVTGGAFSEAWFQNWIHKKVSNDGTYIYNNQGNVNISSGK